MQSLIEIAYISLVILLAFFLVVIIPELIWSTIERREKSFIHERKEGDRT